METDVTRYDATVYKLIKIIKMFDFFRFIKKLPIHFSSTKANEANKVLSHMATITFLFLCKCRNILKRTRRLRSKAKSTKNSLIF